MQPNGSHPICMLSKPFFPSKRSSISLSCNKSKQ
jgi:hypothetical protein